MKGRQNRPRTKTPKLYLLHNLNGTHKAVVVAFNQAEAAERMGSSLYNFKLYGGHEHMGDGEATAAATSEPGRVFVAMIHDYVEQQEPKWRRWWTYLPDGHSISPTEPMASEAVR